MTTPILLEHARLPSRDDARRIGDVLRQHAAHELGLLAALGVREMSEANAMDVPTRFARTAGNDPRFLFIRLFFFGIAVPVDALAAAIAPMSVADWIDWGLLEVSGDQAKSIVQLYPDGEQVFATDRPRFEGGRMIVPEACVMTPGSTTRNVKLLAIRRPVETAVDIGTGCGILGVFAAGYAKRAFGTDLTQRSVDFATFNAALNGVANFEAVRGSLLEPVAERKFDAIIANPPFVISPSNRYIYRDGGMHGDMFVQTLIKQAAALLNPGGTCQFLCDWAHVRGASPAQRVASWFSGLGCDVLVMRVSGMSPLEYARFWTQQLEDNAGAEAKQQAISDWMRYYESQGIEAMSHGHVSMRQLPVGATRKPMLMFHEQSPRASGNISEQVRRMLWNADVIGLDDQTLLGRCLLPVPELRIRQDLTPPGSVSGGAAGTGDAANAEHAVLLRGGLATILPSSAEVGRLLIAMAPGMPLGAIVQQLATASGRQPGQIASAVLGTTRKLLEQGMIEER